MYWNYIDMLFGNFTSPKVRFTIKGIVIPEVKSLVYFYTDKKFIFLRESYCLESINY